MRPLTRRFVSATPHLRSPRARDRSDRPSEFSPPPLQRIGRVYGQSVESEERRASCDTANHRMIVVLCESSCNRFASANRQRGGSNHSAALIVRSCAADPIRSVTAAIGHVAQGSSQRLHSRAIVKASLNLGAQMEEDATPRGWAPNRPTDLRRQLWRIVKDSRFAQRRCADGSTRSSQMNIGTIPHDRPHPTRARDRG